MGFNYFERETHQKYLSLDHEFRALRMVVSYREINELFLTEYINKLINYSNDNLTS